MTMPTDHHQRLQAARAQLLDQGVVPQGVLPEPIERSWSRCADAGKLLDLRLDLAPLPQQQLAGIREQNTPLLLQALPEMENLHAQILGTHSMVILSDAEGTILHALGDDDFMSKAQRVALQPGVSWREENTGTNAIGTALVEQAPVFVMGAEHYFSQNTFLNCSATPIINPRGHIIGVLDVSGDHRQPQEHTMALVRMSAQMIENRLFRCEFARDITLHFHSRAEFIGTLWEGIAVFSPEGRLLALNRSGMFQLGLQQSGVNTLHFADIFDRTLAALLDTARRAPLGHLSFSTHGGVRLYGRVEADFAQRPALRAPGSPDSAPVRQPPMQTAMLDALDTGDPRMREAIERIKKVLGRDLPILIEGETGTGKELLAKATHAASGRKGLFVAINCASIPEGLIEAELFGYEEGAFTGARRSGVPGKILQAHGGTLFLDEIGEMPLPLQARLLRVLQEREIVPLGSAKGTVVDIAIISATNRKLREHVQHGRFREDLYYRLNGVRLTLPPLRERADMETLVMRILEEESHGQAMLHQETLHLLRHHPWRGNVRQLRHVLRAALAFSDSGHAIRTHHLPEDFLEEAGHAAIPSQPTPENQALAAMETSLIRQTLQAHNGNVTAAARQLGIGRATLYRKLKQA